jgi:hypothetical protein
MAEKNCRVVIMYPGIDDPVRSTSDGARVVLRAGSRFLAVAHAVFLTLGIVLGFGCLPGFAQDALDLFDGDPPRWEPLLWGGKALPERAKPVSSLPTDSQAQSPITGAISDSGPRTGPQENVASSTPIGLEPARDPSSTETGSTHPAESAATVGGGEDEGDRDAAAAVRGDSADKRTDRDSAQGLDLMIASRTLMPSFSSASDRPLLVDASSPDPGEYSRAPARILELKAIPPLYTNPPLPGEGQWEWQDMPLDPDGRPLMYRTSYRPSVEYPTAITHMLVLDMKRLFMNLYIGSAEPGASEAASQIEPTMKKFLVAITNAFWKSRHSGDVGTIYRGNVVKKLFPGVATLVTYRDGSVDVLEWNDTIPLSLISDAKQLRHLIVKDGRVVNSVVMAGQSADAEIGLGFLLPDANNQDPSYASSWGGYWGFGPSAATNYGPDWFIAARSAFGIRPDGNLVFAVGHHISTKDLAKSMVLSGCDRAMHADANPDNILANLYYRDGSGFMARRMKLSPEQRDSTLDRYLDKSYTSDFYGFFLKTFRGTAISRGE